VPSTDQNSNANRRFDWQGIFRILLVQLVVLLALAGAFVWYLNWSSEVAWQEFISTDQPVLSSPNHHLESQAPMQTVNGKPICARRAI
jgi:hypothetical protein